MEPTVELAQLIGNAETHSGPRQCCYHNSVVFIVASQQEALFLLPVMNSLCLS